MRTNTQVSDMRIWHVDTSARLSAKAAHEMQTFLHELRKLKKCQRTLDTNKSPTNLDFLSKFSYDIERNVVQERSTQVALTEKEIHWL